MKENLKNVIWSILGIIFFIGSLMLILLFIKGGVWLTEKILPYTFIVADWALTITIFILLPLSIFRKTRGIAGIALIIASYIFGVTLWVYSFLLTYNIWGMVALIIGLVLTGLGVIPIAILATLIKGIGSPFGQLILLLFMTLGTRFFGIYVLKKFEEQSLSIKYSTGDFKNTLLYKQSQKFNHSSLGIASFIIFLITIFISYLIIPILPASFISYFKSSNPIFWGYALLLLPIILSVTGIGFGIAGIINKNYKRVFSILGLIFNSIFLLVYVTSLIRLIKSSF